jgi:hypothetical protein
MQVDNALLWWSSSFVVPLPRDLLLDQSLPGFEPTRDDLLLEVEADLLNQRLLGVASHGDQTRGGQPAP